MNSLPRGGASVGFVVFSERYRTQMSRTPQRGPAGSSGPRHGGRPCLNGWRDICNTVLLVCVSPSFGSAVCVGCIRISQAMDRVPFFTQLEALSTHVETKVESLKQELSRPPGQNPQRYDKGLNRLKKDIQELKKLSEEVRENLSSFSKFSGYLRDAKELVEEQITSTEKMEQYCAQYGYVILPKPEPEDTPVAEATTPEACREKDPEESSSRGTDSYQHVTPELSIHGQMVLQQKELPLLSTAKKAANVLSSHHSSETPITSKIPSVLETPSFSVMGSSVPKPYMLMEDWLAGGEGRDESIALTPDVISTKAPQSNQLPPTKKETEVEKLEHIQRTPLQATTPATHQMKAVSREHGLVASGSCKEVAPGKITTPTEPSLSEFTTHLFTYSNREKAACGTSQVGEYGNRSAEPQVTQIATPEEPVLLSQQNPLLGTYEENGTPEEPVLHYKENLPLGMMQQKTPEEPILTYHENLPYRMRGPKNDADIPKEPILLYQQRTPKALSVFSTLRKAKDPIPPKLLMPCMDESHEIPKTPELSDMTRSILSLVSHQAPPQPHRDHHGLSQHHRDHHEPSYSHRDYHGPTQHHRNHQGPTQHHRDYHEPSYSHRDHQGPTQHHRDHHGPHHAQRDHKRLTQSQREPQDHTQPAAHSHHKLGQSFSAAMSQLNRTGDDENTWAVWGAQQQWSSASASQREKAMWDKFQAGVDQYQKSGIPPSPQLSDITQKILGQMRR